MLDRLDSSEFFFLLVAILTATVLFALRQRKQKKASAESWEVLHTACTTSTKTGKTLEAAWITALPASVSEDVWKPGLKPSAEKRGTGSVKLFV